jgi:hypothetical protein
MIRWRKTLEIFLCILRHTTQFTDRYTAGIEGEIKHQHLLIGFCVAISYVWTEPYIEQKI